MAGLINLGIADMWTKAPKSGSTRAAAGERPDMAEYGASGTPIFGGFLRERGEYDPDLVGMAAIHTYERMRRGDAQVAATLMALKLPIRAAEWDVTVDDEASKVEKEAADFVRTCLFKEIDFTSVLRNALLMLDFGFAVHENVWEPINGQVHLKKCAARLPLTAYRWITDDSGEELAALEQLGYRGNEYVIAQVPVNKMSLFTFNQEGQNYTGLSLLRAMYKPWFYKDGLYKVDAIACERNGMGVPVIILGPDAKTEDRTAAMEFVQSLVTHEKTGLVLPHEYKFSLEGVTGTLRDPEKSIEHHNTQISMAGLAMFMMLGQSRSGSRALGASMSDFFFMSLEATAEQIARVLTLTTVKPLVDYNFAGVVNYPRVVAQEILTLKFETIVDALNKLATSGIVEPDDDLESWVREKIGAPEVDKATVRAVPGPVTGKGLPVTGGAPGAPQQPQGQGKVKPADGEDVVEGAAGGGDAGVDAASVDRTPTKQEIQDATNVLKQAMSMVGSVHVNTAMGNGVKTRRQPRGAEIHLALHEIVSALDKGRDDIAAALRAARPRIQAEVIHKLVDSPVRNMHRVSVAPDQKLAAEVQAILERVRAFGQDQVGQERLRQRAGRGVGDAASIRMAMADKSKDPIGLYADGVVSEFVNGLQARATNLALDAQRRGTAGKGELITEISSDLDEQSDKWIDSVGGKGTNEAFAEGRGDGYEQYADEIKSVIYSALLDINTCETCAGADGQEGETPDDVPDVPNPDCDGGDKCRCVQVFVFNDEKESAK